MSDRRKALEMFQSGFNCGQIVSTLESEICGNDEKIARAATGGFGGGMNCGEVCGTVSGSIYSLGVYCNHCEYNDTDSMEKVIDMTNDFTKRFKEEFGSLRCEELAPDLDMSKCGNYIVKAKELVEEIIERDKNK